MQNFYVTKSLNNDFETLVFNWHIHKSYWLLILVTATLAAIFPDELFSPSEETVLLSLGGSSEPGPTGKSSSRERTSLRPDMEDRERCGLPALWGEFILPGGEGETQGGEGDGESKEGLKWAWAWPVNRKGELRREGEAGERGGAVLEDGAGGTAAGGVEWTFRPLWLNICERGKHSLETTGFPQGSQS